jgi:Flp pilus assembly protein TadD
MHVTNPSCRRGLAAVAPLAAALLLAGCAAAATAPDPESKPEAAAAMPRDSASLIAAGDTAYRKGDLDQAIAEYVKALGVDPKSIHAFYRIARAHEALGNMETAADAYRKVVALSPADASANEGLGLILLRQQKLPQALAALQLAVRNRPTLWRSYDGLGVIADLQGQPELAQTWYRKALDIKPDATQVLNNLGYSRYLVGDFGQAQSYFVRALATAPANGKAWSNLGLVRARQGDYVGAVAAFREMMAEPEAYYSVGYVCMLDHRYDEARQLFQKAIDLSPSYYEAAHQGFERVQLQVDAPLSRAVAIPAVYPLNSAAGAPSGARK